MGLSLAKTPLCPGICFVAIHGILYFFICILNSASIKSKNFLHYRHREMCQSSKGSFIHFVINEGGRGFAKVLQLKKTKKKQLRLALMGGPHYCVCELKPHAKSWNPRITTSGRKVSEAERKRKNAVNSRHLVL